MNSNYEDDFINDAPIEQSETTATDSTTSGASELTCNTFETCTNDDFMKAVFHKLSAETKPVFVSFAGNPSKASWKGSAYTGQILSHSNNNYFSLASFNLDANGTIRRQKNSFAALHAIMLDDIGTKINREVLTLPPSWLIETSHNNYQAGYILKEPLKDASSAEKLMKAIIAADLCDPGANGPTTRLARLPVAVNGKRVPIFKCRLVEWRPELTYTVQELLDGFGLTLQPLKDCKKATTPRLVQNTIYEADENFVAKPKENAVITALKAKGLYKTPLGHGKHDITCPWVDEHTDQNDHGTGYFEPDDDYALGGFNCFHSHGDRLSIRNLLEILEVTEGSAKMKPVIRIVKGILDGLASRAEQVLAESGLFYQLAGKIVEVITDPSTNETRIVEVHQLTLLRAMSRVANWEVFNWRTKEMMIADPLPQIASILYCEARYTYLPILRGIARQPHLRLNGSIVTNSGYDLETALYGVFDVKKFNIPSSPTKADAIAALEILNELLEEVAFDTVIDKSAAFCALLTAAIRPSLSVAPGFLVNAHAIGSGKSYLTRIISTLSTPQNVPGIAFPSNKDEMRKTLIAMLIKSPAVLNFDDMSTDILPSEALNTSLTEEFISGRMLGFSQDITCSTRTLFLFSGNNIQPIRDLARRVLTIHLDPKCESPATRTFNNPNREEEARSSRERYVSAALTIITAWLKAGSQKQNVKTIGSYGLWSNWCRQPLLWLGLPDPATRIFEQLTEDPDAEILGRILTEWYATFQSSPIMVRQVVDRIGNRSSELYQALIEVAGEREEIKVKLLGWWLKKNQGRIIDGMKFVQHDRSRGAAKWKVQVMKVPQVIPTSCEEEIEELEEPATPDFIF